MTTTSLPACSMNICNGCDAAPMAPGQDTPDQPGYCAECLSEARGPVSEAVSDLLDLVGQMVIVSTGSMAFHAELAGVEVDNAGQPYLVITGRAGSWTKRIVLSAVRRVVAKASV